VVRLHERRTGRARSLEEAWPELERRLLPAHRERALEAWLEERRSQASIEVFGRAAQVAALGP